MSTGDTCWPTSAQHLLLQAVLFGGTESVESWRRWKAAVDLDRLDSGSSRFLPQLYRNLERERVRDPSMEKLRARYCHTWYVNQLRLRGAAVVIGELGRRGIDAMLLKGAALTLLHYREPGLRPMDDVDILVRTRHWRVAVDVLAELEWQPRAPVTPRHVEASHAMDFADAEAQRVDLHWHLLPESCWPRADDEFWKRAATTSLYGVPVSTLDPTDQLFHTCVHGVKWEQVPSLRWIVDAAMILKAPSVIIDWDRLLRLSEVHRVILPLRDALTYLQTKLGMPVPAAVLATLRGAAVSRAERFEYRLRSRPASPALGRLREHWLRYRRVRRTSEEPDPISFVGYLQVVLDCDGPGALVHRAFFRHRWRRQGKPPKPRRARALGRTGVQ
ncbi:MAG TPA: nucleotidyltransferase family protein [Candidatus Methylomirabilis sp.]|nr:nucleotidyltransferase family protein [Candidatus Methylomirabilis sp.]